MTYRDALHAAQERIAQLEAERGAVPSPSLRIKMKRTGVAVVADQMAPRAVTHFTMPASCWPRNLPVGSGQSARV